MNVDPIPRRPIAGTKRPIEAVSAGKRLRSKLPRRKRVPLLPISVGISDSDFGEEHEEGSSSSCLHSEHSFDSSLGFEESEVRKRMTSNRAAKRKKLVTEQSTGDEFRRITRSYTKRQEMLRPGEMTKEVREGGGFLLKGQEPELSEGNAASEIQISEITQITGGFPAGTLNENAVSSELTEKFPEISESSCFESVPDAKSVKICDSVADEGSSLQIAVDLSVPNKAAYDVDLDSDLACSEQLSDDDGQCSEYSTCNEITLSEMESELFTRSSDRGSSEYSLSVLLSSPEDFSERSSENSTPSVAFSLFRQLATQFVKSSSGLDSKEKAGALQIDSSQEYIALRFEAEEDEESYKNIRSRERREVVLHDLEEYSSSANHGDLILQQRLLMVNWMVEHSEATELHHETLFLGVSLMDRILSRGCFESERNLQLLGIASITLATRLEEVQPWNRLATRFSLLSAHSSLISV